MSDHAPLSPLKQAFMALQAAQGRIAKLEARRVEPVAIIGVACRIPGAPDGPEGYWSLLRDARCAVSDKAMARWRDFEVEPPLANGDGAVRWSALLDAPDRFDPQFFGISPREAANMDPQQRLLLEASWEALEDAAIAPDSTYCSKTGVYFGIASNDFAQIELMGSDARNINPHLASGGAHSVAAGRVSYTLGWHGPAISIDTACSSSLVAVHLACEAIRSGDCDMALTGGVNLILSPASSIAFARSGMLSSAGRVDAFGLGADGFVRGEGCGVVVLKRLSSARRDEDRVLAVIAGSAVNHDGPGSGLTVPNGQAQAALLRSALKSAGIAPAAVGYVEAHGTGTRLGDPIEAEALGAVFGAGGGSGGRDLGERDRALMIGSVKTNLGHLEAAAGIAGLIKVVLALEHRELPAQLHGDPPSEHVRWSDLPLEVVRQQRQWEPIAGRRIAGVSAFGFSGTNAHVIVEEAPAEEFSEAPQPVGSVEVLALSAKSAASLAMLAERYASHLAAHPEQDWGDVCYTAAVGRTHFKHRLAVVASSGAEARTLLREGSATGSGAVLHVGLGPRQTARDGAALSLAEAYVSGSEPDWAAWHAGTDGGRGRRRVRLPGYAFERERHWLSGSRGMQGKQDSGLGLRGDLTAHPLLGERLRLAGDGARYEWPARPVGELAWLGEHRIAGQAILPATAYLEMLLAAGERMAGTSSVRVEELTLIAPLHLVEEGSAWPVVQVAVDPAGPPDVSRVRVRIYSSNEKGSHASGSKEAGSHEAGGATTATFEWRLHGEGYVSRSPAAPQEKTFSWLESGLEAVRERCPDVIEAPVFYARMQAGGADFGPRFKRVRRVWRGKGEALGEVALETPGEALHPKAPKVSAAAYGNRLHPACLDACLQVAAALLPEALLAHVALSADTLLANPPTHEAAPTWLPAKLEKFQYHAVPVLLAQPQTHETVCLVHATLLPSSTTRSAELGFAFYLPKQARPFATLQKLTFKKQSNSKTENSIEDWFYGLTWKTCPLTSGSRSAAREWIIASSGILSMGSLGDAVANALRSAGQRVQLMDLDSLRAQPNATQSQSIIGPNTDGIVYVHEALVDNSSSPEGFTLQARQAVEGLLDLCRNSSRSGSTLQRLYVLTCNAHAVKQSAKTIYPMEAIVSGLAATISAEYDKLHCVRIDIDANDSQGAASLIAKEIMHDGPDDWIAFRDRARYLPRLDRAPSRKGGGATQINWTPGQGVDSLRLDRVDRRSPGYGEIEIEMRAAGLNFHDVLSVLGVLPDTDPLGSECAGVISRIGPGVTQHKVGDEVVAVAAAALAPWVIAPQDLVFLKPAALSFEQAASLPIAYLTAAYCLLEKGGLAAGKRVLIHAASGGVGLAAVHLCLRYSAEIFATAGSDVKRAYLRSLGIEHVMDSRSATFADEIRSKTAGDGVDIVLNCLAGNLTDAGLSVTAPSGDFVDIGATNIRDAEEVASKHPGVRYHSVDLAALLRDDREGVRRLLGVILKDIGDGRLPPLPVERFELNNAAAAFRHMAAARHIGKVVLASATPSVERSATIRSDGSYIVTGGMTGLGLEVTRWLAASGAKRVVVGGRRAPSPLVAQTFEQLRLCGSEVTVVEGDVADPHTVSRLIEAGGESLRGILHCAGAVHDAPLSEQNWETFSQALQAKADGAWLLHEQTRSKPLDFFVLFSSWASLAGSPKAANYCAANMFLDALAHHRHAMGLPATSINWGPWARIGMAAGRPREAFASKGLKPMLPEAAIQALELAIHDHTMPQIAIADVDWDRVAAFLKHRRSVPAVYERMVDLAAATGQRAHGVHPASKLSGRILPADASDIKNGLAIPAQLKNLLVKVLELPPQTEIDPAQPLQQLGLDSMLAVELANSISTLIGREMPSGLLYDYPTLASLIAYLDRSTKSVTDPSANSTDETRTSDDSILDRLEELTDQEVDRLLQERDLHKLSLT